MTPATMAMNFEVPYLQANQGVYVAITGQLQAAYNSIPANSWVVLTGSSPQNVDYAPVTAGDTVPLLNLFPSANYPPTNQLATVSVTIPDNTLAPILSGQVVISVGTQIALVVGGTAASPTIPSPTPNNNPNDKFGLFEWGNAPFDIDVSEVEQVGFPFQASISYPSLTITGVSSSINPTITAANGLMQGDFVTIAGVQGAVEVNGTFEVAVTVKQ